MRILIIEDEDTLRQQLAEGLRQQGYAIDSAADGREGRFMLREYPYDLAIIDLGLPEVPGKELIKQVRQRAQTLPILVLTARADWQDKVEALELGADDYVVKPYHMPEVAARINALLRRSRGQASAEMLFGPLRLDTSTGAATLHEQPLELTSYEYRTLEYLCHHAGKVISKTELTEHLYDQDFDRDSNVIEVFIGRLRKKLDPSNKVKPIRTLRGRGYCFEWPEELTDQ